MRPLQLIQTYSLVCECYDTHMSLHFQRQSNNNCPQFTDQEAITIYLCGIFEGHYSHRSTYDYIVNHWASWFPKLPSYQAYNARINAIYWHFEVIISHLMNQMNFDDCYDNVSLVDSLPIMLSKHPYTAKVASQIADKGYCDAKKQYYHGVKFHLIGKDRFEKIPKPNFFDFTPASVNDLTAIKPMICQLKNQIVVGDKAYSSEKLNQQLFKNNTIILTPVKLKKKQTYLQADDSLFSKYISSVRQPIESFFKWIIDKTDIQNASKVRSTNALWSHCLGRVTAAICLFIFNP